MAIYGSLGDIDVGAISKSISDTAVDVFVYDTRKDSDGGAWRKRTQHTSWYNETLNTATRGSRRDFPAVAVIVAESAKVTIYDGDDPDMPMWMVFNTTNGSMLRSGVITSISILNAELWVGHGSGSGLHWINFLKDTARWITGSTSYGGFFIKRDISRRNESGANYYNNIGGASDITIADSSINDLAITVLPNAPIDSTTGLSIPTIAVATTTGISVIRDNGTVENTDNANIVKIGFIKGDRLAYGHRGGFEYAGRAINIAPFRNSLTYGFFQSNSIPHFGNSDLDAGNILGVGDGYIYGYAERGIRRIFEDEQNRNNGMANYITRTYNTGWMHGDIKGAFLSDTSTTSVTGTELITNGDFATSTLTSYYSINNCSLAVVSNQLVVTSNTSNYYCEFYMGISDTTKPHYLSFQFVGASNLPQFGIYASPATGYVTDVNAGWANQSYVTNRTIGTYTILIPAGNSQVGFVFPSPAVYTWTFDNISLKPVQELDRSVNNRGLAVYGTITKTAVATGADLVGYSGWSKSNYLLRSGPDLNNSSMTFMTWYKCSSISEEEALISTGDYNTISEVRALYVAPSGIAGFSGWANDFTPGSRSVRDDIWHHLAVTLQYISGNSYVVSVYVDGVLTGTSERTLLTFSNTAIDIGGGTLPLNRFARGSLALCRISTSVISANLMFKIYNDEKVLFQENSKSTLYGSGDVITALAYDDTTKLLHVSTTSGRSDFQGLERINNTTTAVTTAISASNGLIAEQ